MAGADHRAQLEPTAFGAVRARVHAVRDPGPGRHGGGRQARRLQCDQAVRESITTAVHKSSPLPARATRGRSSAPRDRVQSPRSSSTMQSISEPSDIVPRHVAGGSVAAPRCSPGHASCASTSRRACASGCRSRWCRSRPGRGCRDRRGGRGRQRPAHERALCAAGAARHWWRAPRRRGNRYRGLACSVGLIVVAGLRRRA